MPLPPEFLYELHKHFTGDIRTDIASRILYSTDASMYQIEPLGVAVPKNQDDLQSAVELAAKYKTPILPRGSGSSLGGQAIGEALISLGCGIGFELHQGVHTGPDAGFVQAVGGDQARIGEDELFGCFVGFG